MHPKGPILFCTGVVGEPGELWAENVLSPTLSNQKPGHLYEGVGGLLLLNASQMEMGGIGPIVSE